MSQSHIIKEELVINAELTEPLYITGWVSLRFGVILCQPPLPPLKRRENLGFQRPPVSVIMSKRSFHHNFQQSNRKGQWVRWNLQHNDHITDHITGCMRYVSQGRGPPVGVNVTVYLVIYLCCYSFESTHCSGLNCSGPHDVVISCVPGGLKNIMTC